MMDNFALFGPSIQQIHNELENYFYLLLPLFFSIAILIDWFSGLGGKPDFLGTLKRAVIATILVVSFREVSDLILFLADGLAAKISDLSGIDKFMEMAQRKASSYGTDMTTAILKFNDFFLAILSFGSYVVLYFARFVTIALYHFLWATLSILSPILILFTLFKGTLSIPINLYKSLIEVACYKIIWALLSAMLLALSVGNALTAEGDYITLIVLNFIIALAMLATPMIVRSLIGSGLSSMAESLGAGAVMAMVSIPAKAAAATSFTKEAVSGVKDFLSQQFSKPSMNFKPENTVMSMHAPAPTPGPPAPRLGLPAPPPMGNPIERG